VDGASDEEVLASYVDGDRPRGEREAAFAELARRYQRRVFAICVRVLGSPQDAEDATQETFVKLARHAGSFRGESKVSTWLYRVARNVCTDHVRRDARRPATPTAAVADLDEAPTTQDASAAVETGETLRTALNVLDERSRQLLLLVAVDGLSYVDAAAVLDLPVGTVKSRVSRARVRLGELLAGEGPDRGTRSTASDGAGTGAPSRADPARPRGPPPHP
jgi:RNA polymerase sigma-70 factor, ECF subfamily